MKILGKFCNIKELRNNYVFFAPGVLDKIKRKSYYLHALKEYNSIFFAKLLLDENTNTL